MLGLLLGNCGLFFSKLLLLLGIFLVEAVVLLLVLVILTIVRLFLFLIFNFVVTRVLLVKHVIGVVVLVGMNLIKRHLAHFSIYVIIILTRFLLILLWVTVLTLFFNIFVRRL